MALIDPHPGLSKIRAVPLFREKIVHLVRTNTGRVRELVDGADTVSEGATRTENGRLVYYGTTSLLFRDPRPDVGRAAAYLARDPHLRVLALRIARREIGARIAGEIETLRAEISVAARGDAVVVDVDVVVLLASGFREVGK